MSVCERERERQKERKKERKAQHDFGKKQTGNHHHDNGEQHDQPMENSLTRSLVLLADSRKVVDVVLVTVARKTVLSDEGTGSVKAEEEGKEKHVRNRAIHRTVSCSQPEQLHGSAELSFSVEALTLCTL